MSNGSDMVQCEVTGNWIPADEVITFQGKQVGAEGKAILLERLRSGSGEPNEVLPPTVFARFGGMFADGIIGTILSVIVAIPIVIAIVAASGSGEEGPKPSDLGGDLIQTSVQAFASVVFIIYFTVYHFRTGQTPGKRMAHTKVVTLAGEPLTSQQAFWRGVYYYGPNLIASVMGVIFAIIEFSTPREPGAPLSPAVLTFAMVFAVVSGLSGIYGIANILFALFDRTRQRAIHDRLAGTRVIRVS